MANKGLNRTANATSFSKDYQPATAGRKKTSDIKKIMREMGRCMAPADLLEKESVKRFLDANNLKGTINEVLIARLYALALYSGDLKAIKLILDTMNNKYGGSQKGVIINFIAPSEIDGTIELTSDSFTVVDKKQDE